MTCQRSEVVLTRAPPFSRQTSSHFLSTHTHTVYFPHFLKHFHSHFISSSLFFCFCFLLYFPVDFRRITSRLISLWCLRCEICFNMYFVHFNIVHVFILLFGHLNTNISFVPFTRNVFFLNILITSHAFCTIHSIFCFFIDWYFLWFIHIQISFIHYFYLLFLSKLTSCRVLWKRPGGDVPAAAVSVRLVPVFISCLFRHSWFSIFFLLSSFLRLNNVDFLS